nr:MAG TPA: hypothetical protein [Caudoviricetes sp.]
MREYRFAGSLLLWVFLVSSSEYQVSSIMTLTLACKRIHLRV